MLFGTWIDKTSCNGRLLKLNFTHRCFPRFWPNFLAYYGQYKVKMLDVERNSPTTQERVVKGGYLMDCNHGQMHLNINLLAIFVDFM